jgi:hypothetical protein
MPPARNDERRTNNDERTPMTDVAKNLSYLTPTSVINSMGSISYLLHILTPQIAAEDFWT